MGDYGRAVLKSDFRSTDLRVIPTERQGNWGIDQPDLHTS